MQNINLSPAYNGIEISRAGQIYIDGERTKFNVKELVSKKIFRSQGNYAMGLIRPSLIRSIHFLRAYFSTSVYINNWAYGNGNFHQRCYREINGVGAKYSRHKYGMAVDFNVRNQPSDRVYRTVLDHQDDFLAAGFTTMEDKSIARTWTHLDIRETGLVDEILVVGA